MVHSNVVGEGVCHAYHARMNDLDRSRELSAVAELLEAVGAAGGRWSCWMPLRWLEFAQGVLPVEMVLWWRWVP